MTIPAGSIQNVQIVINGTAATGGSSVTPSISVYSYKRTTTVNPFSKANLNTIFQTTVVVPLLAAMNVRWTPSNLTIRVLDDFNDAGQVFTIAGNGAIATDSLPSNQAVYLLFRTALRGRSYRGSKHFGPASEVDTTNDILTGAGLTRWQAVRDGLAASMVDASGNTWVPTVLSRKFSRLNELPIAFVSAEQITGVLLDLNIGTMRKRRSKTIR